MLIRTLFLAAITFFATSSFADTLKSEEDLRPLAESVMSKVAANDLNAAFMAMQPYVVITDSELQSAALSAKAQREQYGVRYGKTIGTEFINQTKVGASLVRILYIEKTEKHALPWTFYFYKTPKGWVLNSFTWSDQVHFLFFGK